MKGTTRENSLLAAVLCGTAMAGTAAAGDSQQCAGYTNAAAVQAALTQAVSTVSAFGAGLGNNMWATVVDAHGVVCLVVNSAGTPGSVETIWLGSRVISAQKANAANAFSLSTGSLGTAIALSTANLYTAVQPGGSLFGLQPGVRVLKIRWSVNWLAALTCLAADWQFTIRRASALAPSG